MVIHKSAIKQYILIYLMMILNGGVLFPVLESAYPTIVFMIESAVVGCGIVAFLLKRKKYGNSYGIMISLFLLVCVVFVRYTVGGIGILAFMEYLTCIMLACLAVCMDKKYFATRVVNAVCFFAAISIVCFIVQIIAPDVLKLFLKPYGSTFSYNVWSTTEFGTSATPVAYTAWGKLFFSMRDGEMSRNLGIFTEPGNYQIVLNGALFLLMFLPKLCLFSPKQLKRRFFIIVMALLTCQSTSGYLIFMTFCVVFFISRKQYRNITGVRGVIALLIFVAVGVLVVDYSVRGDLSFLNKAILSKLFNNGSIDITSSTGYWRMGAMKTSVELMMANPFGNGFDVTLSTIQYQLAGSAGGALMTFGAALGVIPMVVTVLWFVGPILRDSRFSMPVKVAFLVMYLQTSLAQSKVFYPFLVAIVILSVVTSDRKKRSGKPARHFSVVRIKPKYE